VSLTLSAAELRERETWIAEHLELLEAQIGDARMVLMSYEEPTVNPLTVPPPLPAPDTVMRRANGDLSALLFTADQIAERDAAWSERVSALLVLLKDAEKDAARWRWFRSHYPKDEE
jgi:hypothetical protein